MQVTKETYFRQALHCQQHGIAHRAGASDVLKCEKYKGDCRMNKCVDKSGDVIMPS